MQLSEHKSKELISQYGVPVPAGRLARTSSEAEVLCGDISAKKFVVKAQIGAGGRGLAGGIRFAATPSSVREEADRLLGSTLVTEQTGAQGETVNSVYVEAAYTLADQYFIAIALDPQSGNLMVLGSSEGGVAFEQRARMDSNAFSVLVLSGDDKKDATKLKKFLAELGTKDADALTAVQSACKAFAENDMLLLEINPFAKTADGDWLAIDAKIALDPSAAFRHPEFETMVADQGLSSTEIEAQESEINFVRLEGDLGVVVNGAGLGLATNDMIIDANGRPANFMDIRTTARSFDIAKGVEILLRETDIKAILLNVHGGGMTVCDTVAEGVAFAYSRSDHKPPIVARLAGQNADWGLKILKDRGLPVEVEGDLSAAVRRAVELTEKGAR